MQATTEKPPTALDVMKYNPISIQADADLHEAAGFLIDRGFSAAPVINAEGHAIGVLSTTDLLRHERARHPPEAREHFYETASLDSFADNSAEPKPERGEIARVRDVMSRTVYAVNVMTPLSDVVEIMLQKKVHRVFVTDTGGTLVGVITTFDLLKRLAPES